MNTIGYARVSTQQQAEQGLSLEAQEHEILAYCEAYKLGVPEILIERGESAKDIKGRPELLGLLEQVEAGEVDAVVVVDLDRMFRSLFDTLETLRLFEKKGVAFHSVRQRLDTDSPMGRFVVQILGAVSELERAKTGERTSRLLQDKKRRAGGKSINGKAPYGYEWAGQPGSMELVELLREQLVLKGIQDYVTKSALTLEEIADLLNNLGHYNRGGRPWTKSMVHKVLKGATQ